MHYLPEQMIGRVTIPASHTNTATSTITESMVGYTVATGEIFVERAAKTCSLCYARFVTKAFSVVSNRFGIRERSSIWGSRGAGGDWSERIGLGGELWRRAPSVFNQCKRAEPRPVRTDRPTNIPLSLFSSATLDLRFVFLWRHDSHRKINGHFGLRAT